MVSGNNFFQVSALTAELLESYFEIFMLPKNENALLTPENKKVNLNFVGGDWNG